MKKRKVNRLLALLLTLVMLLSALPMTALAATGTKPEDGTTTGNPFAQGTGGSNSFRIPAMVTLNDGTIVAAADARWNTTYDGGGLDTIVSYSIDNGANWNYTFANYLGDNGNEYNGSRSTAFIDPALATDGETVYMLCDLYPYGVALNGSGNTAPDTAVGFNDDGTLKLAARGSSTYNYYLKDGQIYDSSDDVVSGYTVDDYFNITGTDGTSNLFFFDSPYQVVRTGYLYLTKSTDGGKTWSEPTLIPDVKTSSEQVCLVGPGRGLVTDEKIIFPVYSYNYGDQQMGFIYSSDGGATWTRSASFTGASWSSESAVVALSDGTLRFFYRNGTSALCYADYSWTTGWGSVVYTGIPTNSNTQISAISYSKTVGGKQVILVSCPTGPNEAGSDSSNASNRLNGKIFVGYVNSDKTMSWQSDKAISVTSNNNQFMYSCLTELSNGKVAILYEDYESAWGNGYYTMSFATCDLGLSTDSGEENNNPVTVKDETSDVSVTAQGLTSVSAEKQLSSTPYTGYTASVTYSITLNKGTYTDGAEIRIPYDDIFDGCTNYIGSVANADGTADTFSVNLVDGYFVGTAPHFSDVTISGRKEENIILFVGDTSDTFTDDSGNYSGNYTAPDSSIATINIEGKDGQEGGVKYEVASVTCNKLISSNKDKWTATSGYYYTPDGTNYYPVYAKRSSNWKFFQGTTYTYTWGYSTTSSTSNVTPIDTQSTTDTSDTPNIAVYTQSTTDAVPASTTVSFTGVGVGQTTAVVGSTQYNITVNRKTVPVNLPVDGTATYADASTSAPVVSDSTVASATLSGGTLTIKGLKDGTTTVTTDTTVYTVKVKDIPPVVDMETTPFISETGNAQGSKVTKLTISVDKSYDLNLSVSGSSISWSSADPSIATVDQNGTITGVAAGETTVTCTVDGVSYTIPVVVLYHKDYLENNSYDYLCDLYITEITNTTVKYSINLDTALLDAQEGEVIYLGFDYPFCINFFGMQNTGYALSYMAATSSDDQFYSLYQVGDVTTLDAYKNGAMHWQAVEMTNGTSRVQALLRSVVDSGYNGTTGFTRTQNHENITSKLSFRSEKLPTVTKEVDTVNNVPYTEGMTAKEGDVIVFKITVKQYAAMNAIIYSNEKLTEQLSDATFDGIGGSTSINNFLSDSALSEDKENTYYVYYTVKNDDLDTTITNTVEFSYTYKSKYSSGSFDEIANAEAKISAPTFSPQDIVIDFGLPVEIDYSTNGAHGKYDLKDGTAKYGDVDVTGNKVTYTPTQVLSEADTVSLKNTAGGTYTFKVIPASNVLYEDTFLNVADGWTATGISANQAQSSNQILRYGYDESAYSSAANYSNGTAWVATGLSDSILSTGKLSTTFYGCGFDLIGECAPDTAMVYLVIKNSEGKAVKGAIVDTRFADGSVNGGKLYQVPLAHLMLDEGNYRAEVSAYYIKAPTASTYGFGRPSAGSDLSALYEIFDAAYEDDLSIDDIEFFYFDESSPIASMNQAVMAYALDNEYDVEPTSTEGVKEAGTRSVIDGFRVYRSSDNTAYRQDEQNVEYVNVLEAVTNGFAGYIEGNADGNGYTQADYESEGGPQNEIYLPVDTAVTFQTKLTSGDKVQISARAVSGTARLNGQPIETNTEMYYEVEVGEKGVITVTNTTGASGMLAIGNLKVHSPTRFDRPTKGTYAVAFAMLGSFAGAPVEPEPDSEFTPDQLDINVDSRAVIRNKLITVTIKASTDVARLTINGEELNPSNSLLVKWGLADSYTYVYVDAAKRDEIRFYEIIAYDADGVASVVYTVQG